MKNGISYHLKRHRKTSWFVIEAYDQGKKVGYIHLGLETDDEPVDDIIFEWRGIPKVEEHIQYDDGAVILYRLNVEKSHWRKGIGTRLVKLAMSESENMFPFYGIFLEAGTSPHYPEITLEMLMSFYSKIGFNVWSVGDQRQTALMQMSCEEIWDNNRPHAKRNKMGS